MAKQLSIEIQKHIVRGILHYFNEINEQDDNELNDYSDSDLIEYAEISISNFYDNGYYEHLLIDLSDNQINCLAEISAKLFRKLTA